MASDGITRAFNRFGATRAEVLDISKAFNRVYHDGPLHKLVGYLALFHLFTLLDVFAWFWIGSIRRSSSRFRSWSYTFLTIH